MKRSDSAFSIALCASLLVHATLGLLVLREKLAELQVHRVAVARIEPGDVDLPEPNKSDESSEQAPATVIQPAPAPLPEFKPVAPPPPPPPPRKKNDTNDE